MWTATQDGYFSVVENIKDKTRTTVLVRARAADDLRNLREAGVDIGRIIALESADYPYRAIVTRIEWSNYLSRAVFDIDYDNFKNRIHDIDDERARIYLKVWSALQEIERADWDREDLPLVMAAEQFRADQNAGDEQVSRANHPTARTRPAKRKKGLVRR